MENSVKTGIILMNLGSPDSTNVNDVRRYLNEFLMDERVIDKAYLLRLLLVKGIIVPFRAAKSAKAYRSIWTKSGSPLIVLSKQLRDVLQQEVTEPVELAMRYGKPSPHDAYERLLQRLPGLDEVILMPMYPHYAMSSYETAVEYAKKTHQKKKYSFKLTFIKPFYNERHYIDSLAESIRPYLQQEYDHILFSYHGIPERHIYKTDITGYHCLKSNNCCETISLAHTQCYRHQVITTTRLAASKLGIQSDKFSISFQSRLGRDEWLKPYTAQRLEEMPKQGIKKLLVVCPAFVSDCLETLEEMGNEGKEIFLHAGGESFTLIPCLNVHPLWVRAIVLYVQSIQEGKPDLGLA